ncbi:MAG: hypothetical protein ACREX0_00585, partial [Noviherbaspirillum sp.]
NYLAYTNRAMVANTVAIAQLVSLSSWVQYVDAAAQWGFMLGNPAKYPAFSPSYLLMQTQGSILKTQLIDSEKLEKLAETSDDIIRKVLMNAQQVAFTGIIPARQAVMDEVAKANYRDGADGVVTVEAIPSTLNAFSQFVTRYSGNDRIRFAEVATVSAKRDGFQERRSWILPGTYSNCPTAMALGRFDWISRRGGTELLGFDEWKAVDTVSEWYWHPRNKFDVFCRGLSETPSGWGAQSAADNPSIDLDPFHYDASLLANPGATLMATMMSTDSWDYSGIPNFYDLSESELGKDNPGLVFAVRLRRAISETATSQGRSSIKTTSRLNNYQAQPAGGNDLVAVSAAEVFFERPDLADVNCTDGSPAHRDNCYGRKEKGKTREIGSLFNPYWHVRLIQHDGSVREAQALQGVVLP